MTRFVFRSPSQRLQSARGEQRPPVCRHCVVLAFVSPLKPSDQSVIIRLDQASQKNRGEGRSAAVLSKLELFLRGLTLSQLDLAAGNYLMLTSSERVKVGSNWRPLSSVVGAVIYAHFRLADLFDYQTFKDYQTQIVTGISDIRLEPHRLAFLSILIKSLQLHLAEGGDINGPLVQLPITRWLTSQSSQSMSLSVSPTSIPSAVRKRYASSLRNRWRCGRT